MTKGRLLPDGWTTLAPLLDAALERTPENRDAFLDEACRDDADLRARLETMLADCQREDSAFARPAVEHFGALLDEGHSDLPPVIADRYRVERKIGEGGMATVYLARDLPHDRNVAIKVLRSELGVVLGPERFLAEIRLTAKLQHPNLVPLFDSGQVGDRLFYVMPHVEGESLRARLQRERQLPVDEAVRIAVVVARALEFAHAQGIIHRDLKPENLLLQGGEPVVADFGVALAMTQAGGPRITESGLSLGTPQYMSPEQAAGDRSIDARTDVYSLGAVLYEMLVGDPPHVASTKQAILAKVLTERPQSVRVVRPAVPAHVAFALERALERLPADRWASASELADALQGKTLLPRDAALPPAALNDGRTLRRSRARMASIAVAGLFVGGAAVAAWMLAHREPVPMPVRAEIPAPLNGFGGAGNGPELVLSRDGRTLVYLTRTQSGPHLAKRSLDQLTSTLIPGTERATHPALSPDGQWIAFIVDDQLKRVPIDGGTVTTIAHLTGPSGPLDWGPDNVIVLSQVMSPGGNRSGDRGLARVSASGGTVQLFTKPDAAHGERNQMWWPRVLADGETVLYAAMDRTRLPSSRIGVASLRTGESFVLDLPGSSPMGVIDGHVLYARNDGAIMAAPVDLRRKRVTGAPILLVDSVSIGGSGASKSALSNTGTLLYYKGSLTARRLMMVDVASGAARPLAAQPGNFYSPRFSHDGKRLAVTVGTDGTIGTSTIWVYDVASGGRVRLTIEDTLQEFRPVWTADDRKVVFMSNRGTSAISRVANVWSQVADGSARPERLASYAATIGEVELSPGGHQLVMRVGAGTRGDIVYRELGSGDTVIKPLVASRFGQGEPTLSPDGRWLAYVSNEVGIDEIYVRSFPGPASKWQVSNGGGSSPVWVGDGRHIVYRSRSHQIMSATVITSPTFSVARRDVLFPDTYAPSLGHANYDVAPDGKHLLMLASRDSMATVMVTNWFTEVRARLRTARR